MKAATLLLKFHRNFRRSTPKGGGGNQNAIYFSYRFCIIAVFNIFCVVSLPLFFAQFIIHKLLFT